MVEFVQVINFKELSLPSLHLHYILENTEQSNEKCQYIHPFPFPLSTSPREYQLQVITVETLRSELEEVTEGHKQEKERFMKINVRMKIKQRTKQDLGGLTDTVVCT